MNTFNSHNKVETMSDEIAQLIAKPENARRLLYVNSQYHNSVQIRRNNMLDVFRKVFLVLWSNDPFVPVEQWCTYPKVFVWARSKSGGILATALDWIGAVPFDGSTARFYLRGPDGTRASTWLGEDYGHANIEITIDRPNKDVELVLTDAMRNAGWPPQ